MELMVSLKKKFNFCSGGVYFRLHRSPKYQYCTMVEKSGIDGSQWLRLEGINPSAIILTPLAFGYHK